MNRTKRLEMNPYFGQAATLCPVFHLLDVVDQDIGETVSDMRLNALTGKTLAKLDPKSNFIIASGLLFSLHYHS